MLYIYTKSALYGEWAVYNYFELSLIGGGFWVDYVI